MDGEKLLDLCFGGYAGGGFSLTSSGKQVEYFLAFYAMSMETEQKAAVGA